MGKTCKISIFYPKLKDLNLHFRQLTMFHIFIQHLAGSNQALGMSVLKSHGAITNSNWYWVGISALIGFIILFALLGSLALAYLKRKPTTCHCNKLLTTTSPILFNFKEYYLVKIILT